MFPIRDHNPSERIPYVTIALIIANVAIYFLLWPVYSDDRALYQLYADYALIPAAVSQGSHWSGIITSTFLHGGLMHLGGNMLFLWVFGDNMEDQMGHFGFGAFYLLSGIGAGVIQTISDPASTVPVIGASGAVAGVMGGYLLLYPKARVDVFFFFIVFFKIFPIPAWIVLGIWFGIQLFNGAAIPGGEGGVAYWAHIGGFVVGLIATIPAWVRRGATDYWQRVDGHPPHPEATYKYAQSNIPKVPRRRG